MAIYRLSVRAFQRSKGHDMISAMSYRSGERLRQLDGSQPAADARASRVVWTRIMGPAGTPEAFFDRQTLWTAVEKSEKRCDAALAREVVVALPIELSLDQNIFLLQDFIRENFTRRGHICDASVHEPDRGSALNIHAHLVIVERPYARGGGWGLKNRELKQKPFLRKLRERWAHLQNRHLARHGHAARVDHRTLAAQGSDRLPEPHQGATASAMERRGAQSERGKLRRKIKSLNAAKRSQLGDAAAALNEARARQWAAETLINDPEELDFRDQRDIWGVARGPR